MTRPGRTKGGWSNSRDNKEASHLLERHLAGDGQAFERLVQRYKSPVYSYLVRSGIPRDIRDDLFQEVFTRVHAAAASYRPEYPFRAWLFAITANVVRSWYRRQKTRRIVRANPDPVARDPTPDALRQVEMGETWSWLDDAIQKLPARQREVVLMSCVEGLPHEEIAMALGIPINTVKTHLHRARRNLARQRARLRVRLEREVSA